MDAGRFSCPIAYNPKKYPAASKLNAIQIEMANGREMIPHCHTKSALEINFTAAASSMNPRAILTQVIQVPLLGRDSSHDGKMASITKGDAKAAEKATIPIIGANHWPVAVAAITAPTKGAVQENETALIVKAINRSPIQPPFSLDCVFNQLVN